MAKPHNLPAEVATALAQICCFSGKLPQGAPTSPIISNMICSKLDGELQRLAKQNRCYYTRYSDDMTFSTSLRYFPKPLADTASRGDKSQIVVGKDLYDVITQNGFQVQTDKVRLRTKDRRQEVTGITTNVHPNVKRKFVNQIRAMLHAWSVYGLDAAEQHFWEKHDNKRRRPGASRPSFKQVVKGKIEFLGMIRGDSDPVFQKMLRELHRLAPYLVKESRMIREEFSVLVMTEGPTDPKHLKKALERLQVKGLFTSLNIEFENHQRSKSGSGDLKAFCEQTSKEPHARPTVAIFDRDEPRILAEVTKLNEPFKDWGNSVFSFAIPIPAHRQDTPEVCIEFYYKDEEIKRVTQQGRRLFLNNEFDSQSGRHLAEDLNCGDRNKYRSKQLSIVDSDVFNDRHENVALPKNDFSDFVLNDSPGFHDFDFAEFGKIFDVISSLVEN